MKISICSWTCQLIGIVIAVDTDTDIDIDIDIHKYAKQQNVVYCISGLQHVSTAYHTGGLDHHTPSITLYTYQTSVIVPLKKGISISPFVFFLFK